jgi:hypothetical protein
MDLIYILLASMLILIFISGWIWLIMATDQIHKDDARISEIVKDGYRKN